MQPNTDRVLQNAAVLYYLNSNQQKITFSHGSKIAFNSSENKNTIKMNIHKSLMQNVQLWIENNIHKIKKIQWLNTCRQIYLMSLFW